MQSDIMQPLFTPSLAWSGYTEPCPLHVTIYMAIPGCPKSAFRLRTAVGRLVINISNYGLVDLGLLPLNIVTSKYPHPRPPALGYESVDKLARLAIGTYRHHTDY